MSRDVPVVQRATPPRQIVPIDALVLIAVPAAHIRYPLHPPHRLLPVPRADICSAARSGRVSRVPLLDLGCDMTP